MTESDKVLIESERVLIGALMWLRNHYDVGSSNPAMKGRVIERIDAVLADFPPSFETSKLFRERYKVGTK